MNKLSSHFTLSYLYAIILAFIGGFIELYSLKARGVFACMQTGNLVSTFVNFNENRTMLAIENIVTLITFFIGCLLNELLRYYSEKKNKNFQLYVLIDMLIFLIVITCLKVDIYGLASSPTIYDIIANLFVALFGSFQFSTFKTANNKAYSTTMMTTMLKNTASYLVIGITKKDKSSLHSSFCYFLILVSFLIGSLTFYCSYQFINVSDINLLIQLLPIVPIILIVILIILNIVNSKQNKRTN